MGGGEWMGEDRWRRGQVGGWRWVGGGWWIGWCMVAHDVGGGWADLPLCIVAHCCRNGLVHPGSQCTTCGVLCVCVAPVTVAPRGRMSLRTNFLDGPAKGAVVSRRAQARTLKSLCWPTRCSCCCMLSTFRQVEFCEGGLERLSVCASARTPPRPFLLADILQRRLAVPYPCSFGAILTICTCLPAQGWGAQQP